jgi:hypothetical protein
MVFIIIFILFFQSFFASQSGVLLDFVKKKIIEQNYISDGKLDESIFENIKVDFENVLFRLNSLDEFNNIAKEFITESLNFVKINLLKEQDSIELLIDLYGLMKSGKITKQAVDSFYYNLIVEYCFYKIKDRCLNEFSSDMQYIFSQLDRERLLNEFFYKKILDLNYIPSSKKDIEKVELNLNNFSKDSIYEEYANIFSSGINKIYQNKKASYSALDSEQSIKTDIFSQIYKFLENDDDSIKVEIINNNINLIGNILESIKIDNFVKGLKEATRYIIEKIKREDEFKFVLKCFLEYSDIKIFDSNDFLLVCKEIFSMVKENKLELYPIHDYIIDFSKNIVIQYLYLKLKEVIINKHIEELEKISVESELKKKIENILYENVLDLIEKSDNKNEIMFVENKFNVYKVYVDPVVLIIFDELNGIKSKTSLNINFVNKIDSDSKYEVGSSLNIKNQTEDILFEKNNKNVQEKKKLEENKIKNELENKKRIEMVEKYSSDLFRKIEDGFSERSISDLLLEFEKDYNLLGRLTKDNFSYIFKSVFISINNINKFFSAEEQNKNFKNVKIEFENAFKELEEENIKIEEKLSSSNYSNEDLVLVGKYFEINELENELKELERNLTINSGFLKENQGEFLKKNVINLKIIEKITKSEDGLRKTIFDYLSDVEKDQSEILKNLKKLQGGWSRF